MTALDLIKRSLRMIGAIAENEAPSSAAAADALSVWNEMLESWSIDELMISQKTRESFSLVAGQTSYTMGSGGNFNTTRPVKILEANYLQNGVESPLEIITEQQWAEITSKSVQGIPTKLFIAGTFPLETLYPWPVPNAAESLVLHSQKPLTAIASTGVTLSLAPGYSRAMAYNLAIELAPEYGIEPSAAVVNGAKDSRTAIQKKNIKPRLMKSDVSGLVGNTSPVNIFTGK